MAMVSHILLTTPPSPRRQEQPSSHFVPKKSIREETNDQELMCAKILASLEYLLPISQNNQITSTMQWGRRSGKIMKRDKTFRHTLTPFKRNINACIEHRRKHQKCPLDCPRRIEKEGQLEKKSRRD